MLHRIFSLGLCLALGGGASVSAAVPNADVVAAYDKLLAGVRRGQTTVAMGDMRLPVSVVQSWRDRYAGVTATTGTRSATQTGVTKWTSGAVYYAFNANVSAAHRTHFLDAAAEWAAFANLTFTARVAQANYIMVNDVPGLSGGNSSVGMIGGVQQLNIGSGSWNRGTLVHEIGHALGLIHEHQRSDRDTFVTVYAQNSTGGVNDGNFVKIPTSNHNGTYDFLSVMHYSRNAFSTNPATLNTIEPKPAYAQFLNLMGLSVNDRVLSRADRAGIAAMYGAGPAAGSVVTTTKDSGPGSLRTALYYTLDYAADHPLVTTTITFQIPTSDAGFSGGVFTIRPTDRLLAPGPRTVIDATTQTTFSGNTNPNGPEVVLNGGAIITAENYGIGLHLAETASTVKGFVINGWSTQGVLINGTGAVGNTVAGCYIGTNAAGSASSANAFAGIEISDGATANIIGGTSAADRNIISGNTAQGIFIRGAGTNGNFARGNTIGLNASGNAALANGFAAIELGEGASGNTIGGTIAGSGNVLSGNSAQGVAIVGAGASGNTVAGNFIGTDASGASAIGNGYGGVQIFSGASGNTIGPANAISGNPASGVSVSDAGSSGNVIAGNLIGTNAAGTAAIPNAFAGVTLFGGATSNTIGGTSVGARNVISGNTSQGVLIVDSGTNANVVSGNWIGLNATGTGALANGYAGVELTTGVKANIVGGFSADAANVISGNSNQGVSINTAGTSNNRVAGNYIGTNPAGSAAIANGSPGIEVFGAATANIIGGVEPGAGNVISGNAFRGITIADSGTSNNVFAGNLIGLNAAGSAALPNNGPGFAIFGGASANTIGSTTGGRNFISGNNGAGIAISGSGTNTNVFVGNSIGTTPTGTVAGNANEGIAIFSSPQGNIIGGSAPGAANLISGNTASGVAIYNTGTTNNTISGNSITGNGGLAIDLVGGSGPGGGVTNNDSGDADTGPNDLQNYPVLTSATLGTATTIVGTLNSTAGIAFRIEFFANSAGDATGFGEAQNFIGSTDVTTNGSGNASINVALPVAIPAGQRISATATSPSGSTSELAANVTVTTTDTDGDGLPNAYETANGLSTSIADAMLDSDGDGFSNLAEFRAGTNPRSPASVLRLGAPSFTAGNALLGLPSLAGRIYRVEYADDLAAPNHWRILADQIPGTGATITITDPAASSVARRYYRAAALP